MFPSSFKKRERGQVSLVALTITTILLILALSQFSYVSLFIKADELDEGGRHKDALFLNSIHLAKIDGEVGSGEIYYRDQTFQYTWLQTGERLLGADNITVLFDRESWPRPVGLWIEGDNLQLFLRDFWRE